MENPVLEKNLSCIKRYNPQLVEKLLKINSLTYDVSLIETDLKEPNLLYDSIPLHSQAGAEIEAKKIFSQAKNIPTAINVVFGLGLGYLFKEFAENSCGATILYEPNLEILKVTLEIVDYSKELSNPKVFVVADEFELVELFRRLYAYKSSPTLLFLDSYNILYPQIIESAAKKLEIAAGSMLAEYNTISRYSYKSIIMIMLNLLNTFDEIPIGLYKNHFKGKTALIVSAGPSLDENIKIIKENREKVVIFSVGTAFKTLLRNGIKPDFLNILEINDCSSQISGEDLSDVNLILEPYTNNVFHNIKTKRKILYPSKDSHANICWAKLTGIDISSYVAKGTVSYEAASCAKILGFSNIILVGQDLAYVNGQCYSKDAMYSDLVYEYNEQTGRTEIKPKDFESFRNSLLPEKLLTEASKYDFIAIDKLKNLNDTLYFVKGINGEMLPTQGGYATFIEHFKSFASENPDLSLINSSMIGAQIDGFKNVSLENALKNIDDNLSKFDMPFSSFNYDKNYVAKNLEAERKILSEILSAVEKSKSYINAYEKEFRNRNTLTVEGNKYFKLLLTLYDKIIKEYQSKSCLYSAIAFKEDIEVQFLLRNAQNITADSIQIVYSELKNYFSQAEEKATYIKFLIEQQKEKILESLNTEG